MAGRPAEELPEITYNESQLRTAFQTITNEAYNENKLTDQAYQTRQGKEGEQGTSRSDGTEVGGQPEQDRETEGSRESESQRLTEQAPASDQQDDELDGLIDDFLDEIDLGDNDFVEEPRKGYLPDETKETCTLAKTGQGQRVYSRGTSGRNPCPERVDKDLVSLTDTETNRINYE